MNESMLERAASSLVSGRVYTFGGEQFVYLSQSDRPDREPYTGQAGALWADSSDPSYVVLGRDGRIIRGCGWGTGRYALDLVHESRHADLGWDRLPQYDREARRCDSLPCGMAEF